MLNMPGIPEAEQPARLPTATLRFGEAIVQAAKDPQGIVKHPPPCLQFGFSEHSVVALINRSMTVTDADLLRFLDAQCAFYDQVTQELTEGRKRTHWMWFIFPQLAA